MKQQKRMKIMKDLMKNIRSRDRMDAKSRWWVSELLAADCDSAWIHTGWEDAMQKWYEWLKLMTKKDEKVKMEEMHQNKVTQMMESAGLLHKISEPTACRGGAQIFVNEDEDARLLDRCEAKRKEWAKHWQCDEEVQNVEEKPWKNEDLRSAEEALPMLKECGLEKVSRLYKI